MLVPHHSRFRGSRQQANRTQIGSSLLARGGFSLIELLIVIAILTIVTAFVVPAVMGTLDGSRLRSGAVDIQKAWGTARTTAIREGMAMEFRCELGGSRWKIERTGQTVQVTTDGDDAETASGLTADTDLSGGMELLQDTSSSSRLMREGRLPEGITFADLSLLSVAATQRPEAEPEEQTQLSEYGGTRRWSDPIRFQPDGRSQDARLRLRGADSFVVHVSIRGLTSAVSFSAPFRSRASQNEFGRDL